VKGCRRDRYQRQGKKSNARKRPRLAADAQDLVRRCSGADAGAAAGAASAAAAKGLPIVVSSHMRDADWHVMSFGLATATGDRGEC
jgi:NaMN:DMB phosphoribosyltransferase